MEMEILFIIIVVFALGALILYFIKTSGSKETGKEPTTRITKASESEIRRQVWLLKMNKLTKEANELRKTFPAHDFLRIYEAFYLDLKVELIVFEQAKYRSYFDENFVDESLNNPSLLDDPSLDRKIFVINDIKFEKGYYQFTAGDVETGSNIDFGPYNQDTFWMDDNLIIPHIDRENKEPVEVSIILSRLIPDPALPKEPHILSPDGHFPGGGNRLTQPLLDPDVYIKELGNSKFSLYETRWLFGWGNFHDCLAHQRIKYFGVISKYNNENDDPEKSLAVIEILYLDKQSTERKEFVSVIAYGFDRCEVIIQESGEIRRFRYGVNPHNDTLNIILDELDPAVQENYLPKTNDPYILGFRKTHMTTEIPKFYEPEETGFDEECEFYIPGTDSENAL